MYRYHGRANAIRPYNNPQNPVNPDSKPGYKHTKNQPKPTPPKQCNPIIRKIRDSKPFNHRKYYIGTCRGKDAKHHVSTGKIVQTIGKCIGIMGGRMQFAPTIILKIL